MNSRTIDEEMEILFLLSKNAVTDGGIVTTTREGHYLRTYVVQGKNGWCLLNAARHFIFIIFVTCLYFAFSRTFHSTV